MMSLESSPLEYGVPVGKYWAKFDASGYAKENYLGEIEKVDLESRPAIARALSSAMVQAGIQPGSLERAIDFFGGGLPVGPALSANLLLPYGESLWTDKSAAGNKLAFETILAGKRGKLDKWDVQEAHFSQSGFGPRPIAVACVLGKAVFLDADCPPWAYCDIATNCCGTESSTADPGEYEFRTRSWVKSVRAGGLVIRTLSQGSTGYWAGEDEESNPVWCPAIPVTIEDEAELLHDLVEVVDMGFVPADPEEMGPHTWDGLGWMVGIRKSPYKMTWNPAIVPKFLST